MTTRTLTIVTANIGRGVPIEEYKANIDRLKKQVPGQHVFYGFQEIDEADRPAEMQYLRNVFAKTHRFVGTKTAVPIAVPRSFKIARRTVTFASTGVAEFSPHRELVQAVVYPEGKPDDKIAANNIHLGRNVQQLKVARAQATSVIERRLDYWQDKDIPAWLTADLNSARFRKLGVNEKRFVQERLDYIRAYPAGDVTMEKLDTGTVDLTVDGHNAHWVKTKVVWP